MSVRSFLRPDRARRPDGQITVGAIDAVRLDALREEATGIWASAMGYPSSLIATRASLIRQHLREPDLRAVTAHESDGTLVGFAYGYRSQPGQWWHDEVHGLAERAGNGVLLDWLADCHELCELHVRPHQQGRGIGRRLAEEFLATIPARRVILSTPDSPTAAVSLYEALGMQLLAPGFVFSTDARPFAIYGIELTAR
ncbi:GNAT family N-acetyltransferase [Epidermidibacterium keratini]|uniref:GNAT family N-acetyltransferase n=1 Tax=Epidermidibacterium keratini TaxID=1891644 RepID=A0A7L4YKT1_9ACTN|nr:GNAT family N-acetyltransferase [Epidermidibacterium keratini]QHB99156.1 GNAT family N-acetyltransferase [Epidermidibacterium keratini]